MPAVEAVIKNDGCPPRLLGSKETDAVFEVRIVDPLGGTIEVAIRSTIKQNLYKH